MVVNASPVGMHASDGLPADLEVLDDSMFVGDVVISESPTPLIRLAMDRGCQWTQGSDMLTGQMESLLDFFGVARPSAAAGAQR
jgi:shikimate dehydrogenase